MVDDQPAPVGEVLADLARRIGAPPPRRVPVWLARLLAGEQVVSRFTTSTRTSNARFRHYIGWSSRFRTFREGLDQVVAA